MKESVKNFLDKVSKRNANEPEYMQAVHEVAETIIPFIEENEKYQNKMLLERMVEPERVIMFRVSWLDDEGNIQISFHTSIPNKLFKNKVKIGMK